MKQKLSISILFTLTYFCVSTTLALLPPGIRFEKCSITLKTENPCKEFGVKNNTTNPPAGKPTFVAQIILKKHSKNSSPLVISQLTLKWHGPHIEHLFGSLYKKDIDREFLPLQFNLLSDGIWNQQEQELTLTFEIKQKIHATTIFCLLLNLSPELKTVLSNGYFTVEDKQLPDDFKSSARSQKLFINCPPLVYTR